MALFMLAMSTLLIVLWFRTGKDVDLPTRLEDRLICWREKFPSSPLITKTIELGDQVEFNVIEALSISHRVEHKHGKGVALQIRVDSPTKEEKSKLLACLKRRFPEVGFVPCKEDSEEYVHRQDLKI